MLTKFDKEKIDALEMVISKKRFSKYVDVTENRQEAFMLYEWNKIVSKEFYYLLQETEVIIRNSIHLALIDQYGEYWYDHPDIKLNSVTKKLIKNTLKKMKGTDKNPDLLVSRLTFGFWVELFKDKDYEMTLWRPALRLIFPPEENRKSVYRRLQNLSVLRNRIAHHEPIFKRDIEEDYNNIMVVLGWLSEEAYDWLSSTTQIPNLLNEFEHTFKKLFISRDKNS